MMTAKAIDDALAGTFPASDPPAWTPGITRPAPKVDRGTAPDESKGDRPADVIDLSRPQRSNTFADGVRSLMGAIGLALLAPVVLLAIGLPLALAVRGMYEAVIRVLSVLR